MPLVIQAIKFTGQSIFPKLCEDYGYPRPVAEYRFAPPRRWRLDWAFLEDKIAVEVQGGIWTGGRHVRGAALLREHEKINELAARGWRTIFTTPKQFESGEIFAWLDRLFSGGNTDAS